MWSLIIGFVLALIVAVYGNKLDKYVMSENKGNSTIGDLFKFISFLIFLASFVVPIALGMSLPTEEIKTSTKSELISLGHSSLMNGELNGSLFAVSGYSNQVSVYTVYYKDCTGYVQGNIPTKGTMIYEDEPEGYAFLLTNNIITYTDTDVESKTKGWLIWIHEKETRTEYELHVPAGTILRKVSLQ